MDGRPRRNATADTTNGAGRDARSVQRNSGDRTGVRDGGGYGVAASFGLSYLLGFGMLAALVLLAGFWDVIANSRFLAALLAAGILPLGEDDPGLGSGVPEVNLWIRSQDPVDWLLVLLAAILFIAVAVLKGLQFHRLARSLGIDGSFGQHARAFFYGHGISRMLPYRTGEVAWAAALEGQGATLDRAARVVLLFKGFLLFEIAAFAFIGLLASGLLAWATALVWPLLILAAAYLFTRPRGERGGRTARKLADGRQAFRALAREPRLLAGLAGLSLLAFFLVELASYIVPQAFVSLNVPLVQDEHRIVVVSGPLIIMAVVGGYIARLIPVTPGGIGQFEWAFALVLTTGGLALPEAATIALLVSAVRYVTGALLFAVTLVTYGIETNLRRVLELFARPAPLLTGEAR